MLFTHGPGVCCAPQGGPRCWARSVNGARAAGRWMCRRAANHNKAAWTCLIIDQAGAHLLCHARDKEPFGEPTILRLNKKISGREFRAMPA